MFQMLDDLTDPADHLALDEAVLMREASESVGCSHGKYYGFGNSASP